jgi:DNA polymerase-3 subunit alpha
LGAIKGTGQGAIEAIVANREAEGPFTSLFNFCQRVDKGRVNKRVVEALIKAGAFDELHPDRGATLASVGLAFEWAQAQAANANQGGLFDAFGDDSHGSHTQEPPLASVSAQSVREKLTLEKAALGFYLSGHLFDQDEPEVRKFCKRRIADLVDARELQIVAGIVGEMRVVNGQRGRVGIFKLDDGSEPIEAVVNEEQLDANKELLVEDALVIVQGKVQNDRFSGGLRLNATQVWDLAAARARFGRCWSVTLPAGTLLTATQARQAVASLAQLLRQHPPRVEATELGDVAQGLAVRFQLHRGDAVADLELGAQGRFWPSEAALSAWRTWAPEGATMGMVYEGA